MDERTREALDDMSGHAREAHALAERHGVEEALADRVVRLAIERLLEIIGEAASRVPPEVREDIDIPWREIVGMRQILAHADHRTDPVTLAGILAADLAPMAEAVETYLAAKKTEE